MICQHRNENSHPVCSLGMYGGMPSYAMCKQCVERGQNNLGYAKELFEKAERTHPTSNAIISGCCDSARNYIE